MGMHLPVQVLPFSFVFGFGCSGLMWNLSSQARDRTCTAVVKALSPDHWTTREVPLLSVLFCILSEMEARYFIYLRLFLSGTLSPRGRIDRPAWGPGHPHPLPLLPGPGPWPAGLAMIAVSRSGPAGQLGGHSVHVHCWLQHSSGEIWSCRANSKKLWHLLVGKGLFGLNRHPSSCCWGRGCPLGWKGDPRASWPHSPHWLSTPSSSCPRLFLSQRVSV